MAVTVQNVKDFCPNQADRGDATIALWLTLVPRSIKLEAFPSEDRDFIILNWVAHKLTITDGNAAAAGGALTASTVGGVTEQFSPGRAGVSDYERTPFGQELLGIFRSLTAGGLTSGVD